MAMTNGALLVLKPDPGEPEQRWKVTSGVTTIGRAPDCDVVLPDREVSRQHAQLRREDDRFVLVDLGSKNGTFLNGVRVAGAARLADGDELRIPPRYRLLFVDSEATAVARPMTGTIAVDEEGRTVTVGGQHLDPPLARQQFLLIQLLAGEPNHVFSRDEIAAHCYPEAEGGVSDHAIDGIVRRLRARLAEADPTGEYLVAVRGHGFKLKR